MAQWIEDPQGRPEVEKVTKELKLPVWKANHKGKFRDFWNELWDKIEDYCIKLKEGTKKTDDRLNSAIGRNDGDFPIANAVVGDVYYSDVTKKYYKCKIGGPAPMPNGNFIDLSILENLNRLENLITLEKGEGNLETNIGGLILKVYAYPSKTGLNRYNFYTAFPNKCLVCILSENDGIRNTEPALEAFDKNGFKTNNVIGTGQFFCTAIGY